MKIKSSNFLFYLLWAVVFIIVNVVTIFILNYFQLPPFASSNSRQEPSAEWEQQQEPGNTRTPAGIIVPSPEKPEFSSPPPYLENIQLKGEAYFLNENGTSFQAGFITLRSLFPNQFELNLAYLPPEFKEKEISTFVDLRITLGWNNLPSFNALTLQKTEYNSHITVLVPSLEPIQFQFSTLKNYDFDTNRRIQRIIQTEINKMLRSNRISDIVKRDALRTLGTHYTLHGLENITMEYQP